MEELGFELIHLGINAQNAEEANACAKTFERLFGFFCKAPGNSSTFCGPFEVMHGNGRGTHGHIAIGTYNVEKAVEYLKDKGVTFDDSTTKYDDNGKMKFIYLNDEICGFAVHLIRKA